MNIRHKNTGYTLLLTLLICLSSLKYSYAESAEINGDTVEYSIDANLITAKGNVEIKYKDAVITCDEVQFLRDTKKAKAKGNVVLKTENGTISGDNIDFDFNTMTGQLNNAKITSNPYYGAAEKVYKIGDDKILMENGYLTTSDYDKPGYRLTSNKIEIYPKDKIVAKNVVTKIGNVPVMYFPRYTQIIRDRGPGIIFIPGYDKDWGMFLLTKKRYHLNDYVKGIIHLDFRERKDVASGLDVDYTTNGFGEGIIRTYYMNERSITSKRFWQKRPSPTPERERYKIQWRHKWNINDKTNAIMQYYNLSDSTLIKDYFEKEYREDSSPDSYFLLTKTLNKGVLSFRTDVRINRWESKVERLPEVRYDLSSLQLLNTGIYFKNTTTYSNLVKKTASPSEVRQNTMRTDTDNEFSYPMRVGIFEVKPYVGERYTYYSKTKDPEKYGAVRNIFKTGTSISTKFYKIFDSVHVDNFFLKADELRHIITPSVSYSYVKEPSVSSSALDSFDSIDSLDNEHKITFSLENKLQTKRDENTVDILRAIVSSDFGLKEDPSGQGFNTLTSDVDFKPTDWLSLYFDSTYDMRKDHLSEANFNIYINGGSKWSLGLGKRYNRAVDDQLNTELKYMINQKWKFTVLNWFDLDSGGMKEQNYILTRDLHSWIMDISLRNKRGEGSEFVLYFTLKAFPDMGFDMGTSFNQPQRGAQ